MILWINGILNDIPFLANRGNILCATSMGLTLGPGSVEGAHEFHGIQQAVGELGCFPLVGLNMVTRNICFRNPKPGEPGSL